MQPVYKREGFEGQIQYVIPDPILKRVNQHILVSGLYPTDFGWYPLARFHRRQRDEGAAEDILILCAEGSGWVECRGVRQSVTAGQAILIPRGTPHSYGAHDESPWSIHWMHFLGGDAPYFLSRLRQDSLLVPVSNELMSRLRGLFHEAYTTLADGITQPGILCAAQTVRHLLTLLFFDNPSFHPHTKAPRTETLERTLQFLREHVDTTLTVADMAGHADLSETHFARQFRRHTGFSPMDYFIHLKMQHAARLLTVSPLRVKQVAAEVGYDDPYYFSRIFRKIMGSPPTTYRRQKLGTQSRVDAAE